jgi:CPA1 family monovalent cation:H+ antiporter
MEAADVAAIVLVVAALIGCTNHLWVKLPPTIGVLIGSLVLSLLIVASDRLFHLHVMAWFRRTLDVANFPNLFLDGVLALLLFAGSLHVDLVELRQRKWMILLLATASVLLSTVVFGVGIWAIFTLLGTAVPLAWCYVLGAILAPTDAVVLDNLLRRVTLPSGLRGAMVGESLFNDGAGVVLFLIALRVTQGESISIGHGEIAAALIREIVGGTVLGLAAGWLAGRLIRVINDDGLQLMISLAVALGCYRLANWSDVSGPIAVVAAGLCIGSFLSPAKSGAGARSALIGFWSLLDQFLNMMLFLLIGLQILGIIVQPAELAVAACAIPLALASRMLSVAIPWGLTRGSLRDKARGVAVLTWAGLRGGISVALALTLPVSPWRGALLIACYAVVVFTIVVQGLTMPAFLRAVYGKVHPDHADQLIE